MYISIFIYNLTDNIYLLTVNYGYNKHVIKIIF